MDIQNRWTARAISLGLALALVGTPEFAGAALQQDAGAAATQTEAPAAQQPDRSAQPAQQPAGAAAAQQAPTSGGAASKPAGMAIAPAKQRQVRSLLIKLGAIAGGAVAIGTVVALTKASPSKPPGAK